MKHSLAQWGTAGLMLLAIAGCGGGGSTPAPVTPPLSVKDTIAAAAVVPANDTATNPTAAFSIVQGAGVPAVTINGKPKVNFSIFSDGQVKTGITFASVRVAIAKLVPGTNGTPDTWVNYLYSTRNAAKAAAGVTYSDAVKATLDNPAFPSTIVATTDTRMTTATASRFSYNPDGYYSYDFDKDITLTTNTNGVVFEPGKTHRVAVQLTYTNASGNLVAANPYFDFTVDASGKSVPVTDPSKTRKMTDVASCNGCHEKLAIHGGGRVDTQYCVLCHNPSTVDPNSGNNLNLATMVHKIHSARLLAGAAGGENMTIGTGDFTEVGFPQDLRNCTKCHSAVNPSTPQGDNWKTVPSQRACLTCHANKTGSDWDTSHQVFARDPLVTGVTNPAAKAKDLADSTCVACHKVGSAISPERVHWNQNEENSVKYKMNIEGAAYDAATRKVTVKYFLSDPTNNNATYNLVTPDCTGTSAVSCGSSTKFGNLRFYLAYQNVVGQSTAVTEPSAYNNGGSGANAYAYTGTNDGSNHYSVNISVPADTTYTAAVGTARVVSIGQIKEVKLQAKSATDPRPAVVPTTLINTLVQNTFRDVALTGVLQPRRVIVSNEKCNVCHGSLGATSGSNTLDNAFHSGARNTVEACVICHDANRVSSSVMTNGLVNAGVGVNESYQMKRMIHGIHGNSKRTTPFNHGNPVVGAFDKTGVLTTTGYFLADQKATIGGVSTVTIPAGTPVAKGTTFAQITKMVDDAARAKGYTGSPLGAIENYAAEVAYPQVGLDCNACHVNNSYKQDLGPLGAVVSKPGGTTDPNAWNVISPKAASCTACHDSSAAIGHVTSFGGSAFGNMTQKQIAGLPRESCDDCHSPGGFKGVDIVHGQK